MRIRTFQDDDFETLVRAFDATWGWELETDEAEKTRLAVHYVAGALAASNYTRVVETDGHVLGVMCSVVQGESDEAHRANPYTYMMVAEQAKRELLETATGREIVSFYDRIAQINRDLEAQLRSNALDWQAEMTLLLCDPSATGRGVGRLLVADLFDYLSDRGVRWCILKTDTHCAWEYYVKTGWTQAATKCWEDDDIRAFAFRKEVVCRR